MKNIHVIPTSKPSRLYLTTHEFIFEKGYSLSTDECQNKNIYITNSEEIKEGDWFYDGDGELCKYTSDYVVNPNGWNDNKKIILTTDQDLINDGVQAIDDEFLEWFVKNPSCEEVKLENHVLELGYNHYKIIIPKEENSIEAKQRAKNYMSLKGALEPKQEIVGYRLKPSIDRMMVDGILKNAMPNWNDEDKSVYFIKGHVGGSLVAKMKELQVLDLWFTPIYESEEVKSDWVKDNHLEYYHKEGIMKEISKQETLEEVAKIDLTRLCYYDKRNPDCSVDDEDIEEHKKSLLKKNKTCSCDNCFYGRTELTEQLIWQQERMYSEEDMREAYKSCYTPFSFDRIGDLEQDFKKWFEQFKKK